jgi:hypothetical protein
LLAKPLVAFSQQKVSSKVMCWPLLFSLSVQELFTECIAGLPDLCGVAVFDDFDLVGHPASVFTALDRLSDRVVPTGLQLRRDKCKVLWPHKAPVPESLSATVQSRGLSLVQGAMPTLGGIIGFDTQVMVDWCLAFLVQLFIPHFRRNLRS